LHIDLTPVDAVHIGRSLELKLIISQVWQEFRWLNLYTQIILRNKTVSFPQSIFIIYNQLTVFGYIYNLLMTGRWEMHKNLVRNPQGKVSVQRRIPMSSTS